MCVRAQPYIYTGTVSPLFRDIVDRLHKLQLLTGMFVIPVFDDYMVAVPEVMRLCYNIVIALYASDAPSWTEAYIMLHDIIHCFWPLFCAQRVTDSVMAGPQGIDAATQRRIDTMFALCQPIINNASMLCVWPKVATPELARNTMLQIASLPNPDLVALFFPELVVQAQLQPDPESAQPPSPPSTPKSAPQTEAKDVAFVVPTARPSSAPARIDTNVDQQIAERKEPVVAQVDAAANGVSAGDLLNTDASSPLASSPLLSDPFASPQPTKQKPSVQPRTPSNTHSLFASSSADLLGSPAFLHATGQLPAPHHSLQSPLGLNAVIASSM